MTNKRKKLIRAVAERTGVSHAGAANILNKTRLVVDPRVLEWTDIEQVFAPDLEENEPMALVGGFNRASGSIAYEKDPEDTAYVIGEGGETVLSLQKPTAVRVPLVSYHMEGVAETPSARARIPEFVRDQLKSAIRERMRVLLETAATQGYQVPLAHVAFKEAGAYFLKQFSSKTGTVRMVRGYQGELFGVLDHAGLQVIGTQILAHNSASQLVGLVAFQSRVHGIMTDHQGDAPVMVPLKSPN